MSAILKELYGGTSDRAVSFPLPKNTKECPRSKIQNVANLGENDNYFIDRFISCDCITFFIPFEWSMPSSYK